MPGFPSPSSTYLISHETTQRLVVAFARNPASFALNQYVTVFPMTKESGAYVRLSVSDHARQLYSDPRDFVWRDGADVPEGMHSLIEHSWHDVRAERYVYPFELGRVAVSMASWDIPTAHLRAQAMQAMVVRARKTLETALNPANWPANHVIDVQVLTGTTWDAGTTTTIPIRRSLTEALQRIGADTLGVVGPRDLRLVVSPSLARRMSQSQELLDYVKASPDAIAYLESDDSIVLPGYGLPPSLLGVRVVIEDAWYETAPRGAASNIQPVLPDNTALLVARPGSLEGGTGGASFSTLGLFTVADREMQTVVMDDPFHQKLRGYVTDYFAPELVAPVSGVLFTNVI